MARRVVREHGDWTAREEISRKQKKRKKKYNAPAEGKPARVAWQCSPSVIGINASLQ